MNSESVAQLRTVRSDSDWRSIYPWLWIAAGQVGQRTAGIFPRSLSRLIGWTGRIGWACELVRALPREGEAAGAENVVRARLLLLGVGGNRDDRSTAAPATFRGSSSRTRPATAWAFGLVQHGWCALGRIREQDRLRKTLYRLSDRELRDMGIHRGEIESIVGTGGGEAEYMSLRPL